MKYNNKQIAVISSLISSIYLCIKNNKRNQAKLIIIAINKYLNCNLIQWGILHNKLKLVIDNMCSIYDYDYELIIFASNQTDCKLLTADNVAMLINYIHKPTDGRTVELTRYVKEYEYGSTTFPYLV